MSKQADAQNGPKNEDTPKQPGAGVPLVSKLGSCERCGFHFVVMCSMNDTSTPCPLCENAVGLSLV